MESTSATADAGAADSQVTGIAAEQILASATADAGAAALT